MKLLSKKMTLSLIAVVISAGFVVTTFQNCGKAGFDSSLDSTLPGNGTDAALATKYGSATGALVSAAPFAFDAGFDQITYNSCAESAQIGHPEYFTIKAGSYSTMGVKLRDNFISYVIGNFKPNYGETGIDQTQYENYLSDSPANKGAVANLAIRVRSNLESVMVVAPTNSSSTSGSASGVTVTVGKDVIPLVSSLTDPRIMDPYTIPNTASAPPYINYFPFSNDTKVFEGSLSTLNSSVSGVSGQTVAQQYRDFLSNSGILALTYLNDITDGNIIRSPSAPTTATAATGTLTGGNPPPMKTAYGRGYQLHFSSFQPLNNGFPINYNLNQPTGFYSNVAPNNWLSTVDEIDLASGSRISGAVWNCNRHYMVVRLADQTTTLCPKLTYAQASDPRVQAELQIARRQLPASNWDINPIYGCAIPKGQISCYKEDEKTPSTAKIPNVFVGVNYWPAGDTSSDAGTPERLGECFSPSYTGSYSTNIPPLKLCPQFITICVRQ